MRRVALVAIVAVLLVKGWHLVENELDVDDLVSELLAGIDKRLHAEVLMDAIDREVGR